MDDGDIVVSSPFEIKDIREYVTELANNLGDSRGTTVIYTMKGIVVCASSRIRKCVIVPEPEGETP